MSEPVTLISIDELSQLRATIAEQKAQLEAKDATLKLGREFLTSFLIYKGGDPSEADTFNVQQAAEEFRTSIKQLDSK